MLAAPSKKIFQLLVSSFFMLLCLFCQNLHAFVAGVRTTGMGGAGIAYSQDAFACVYNPAGGVDVRSRMDLTANWNRNKGRTVVRGNLDPSVNGSFNPFITKDIYDFSAAFNKRFCCKVLDRSWLVAFSLAGYNRNYQKTKYKVAFPLLGNSNVGFEYIHETLLSALSFQINKCHSLGVSLDLHIQRFKVDGIQNFDNLQGSLFPGHVTNRGYSYSFGVGLTAGWKWYISDHISLGFTYRPKASMTKFHKYKGFLAQHGKSNIPEKIGFGLSYDFLPCATFAFDAEWINWKPIKSSSNNLLHDGQLELMGSADGPGFGFRNQIYFSVGVDYQINDLFIVRAGYTYNNTPIKRSQTVTNALTMVTLENYVTCGATYLLGCSQELSFCYAHAFNKKVKGRHSIPPEFGGGEVDLKANTNFLGVSWAYLF